MAMINWVFHVVVVAWLLRIVLQLVKGMLAELK